MLITFLFIDHTFCTSVSCLRSVCLSLDSKVYYQLPVAHVCFVAVVCGCCLLFPLIATFAILGIIVNFIAFGSC